MDVDQTPSNFDLNEAESLFRWSARVRGDVLDHILTAPLNVVAQAPDKEVADKDGWVALWATPPAVPGGNWNEPPAPPSGPSLIFAVRRPTVSQFRRQLSDVCNHAILRSERQPEILQQVDDILPFLGMVVELAPERQRYTMELIEACYRCIVKIEMRFKNALGSRRPGEYVPQVQPMIPTPGHSTFPSGHATEAFALAYLLAELSEPRNTGQQAQIEHLLMRHAARIAENRVVAGVHFPVDNEAGATLGLSLGRYLVHRIRATSDDPGQRPPLFASGDSDPRVFDGTVDRNGSYLADAWAVFRNPASEGASQNVESGGSDPAEGGSDPSGEGSDPSEGVSTEGTKAVWAPAEASLGELWKRARQEWP